MKKIPFLPGCEPVLMYFILYFPSGYFTTGNAVLFNTSLNIFIYSVISVFQILFLIYFMNIKGQDLSRNGLKNISPVSFIRSAVYIIPLFLIVTSVTLITGLFSVPAVFHYTKNLFQLALALPVSFITGYREELFFRSYLIPEFERIIKIPAAIVLSSFLFAVSHTAMGIQGITVSFSAALFFGYIFIKHRDLHTIALTHSFYNMTVLLLNHFKIN